MGPGAVALERTFCVATYFSRTMFMSTKKRGRPATGVNPVVGVRLAPALLTQLDKWRLDQSDSPNRPEAVRRLLEEGLRAVQRQSANFDVSSDYMVIHTDDVPDQISPPQCRAARALLNWSQDDLVRRSNITKKTVADFERGATQPRSETLMRVLAAFEAAGIEFLCGNRPGVQLKRR